MFNKRTDYKEKYADAIKVLIEQDIKDVKRKIKELDNKKVSKVKDARKNIEKIKEITEDLYHLEDLHENCYLTTQSHFGRY